MKVALTAAGQTLEGAVDPRFGRTPYIIVKDTDSDEWSVHENTQNLNAAQGAGIQTASRVADLGANAVLTGDVGPKAFKVLEAAGVDVYIGVSGTVTEALAQHAAGAYERAAEATVEGHWV